MSQKVSDDYPGKAPVMSDKQLMESLEFTDTVDSNDEEF